MCACVRVHLSTTELIFLAAINIVYTLKLGIPSNGIQLIVSFSRLAITVGNVIIQVPCLC